MRDPRGFFDSAVKLIPQRTCQFFLGISLLQDGHFFENRNHLSMLRIFQIPSVVEILEKKWI